MLRLCRLDPARNMARWYAVEVTPDLFGGACLIRRWGRIGQHGQERREWFPSPALAKAAGKAVIRAKTRRGYATGDGAARGQAG
ncbi:WGR domain-containing protein [Paracoccus jiaweipingae]|uniref:WGR domain-containing protein n=1 Tax=unclassified Paracoccus (in: a-proteobacteria) TaxID=2688777 RepID=UPI0037BB25CC